MSATLSTPRTAPSQATRTAVWPFDSAAARAASSRSGTVRLHSRISAGRPTSAACPSTTPSTPSPSRLANDSTGERRGSDVRAGVRPRGARARAAIARAIGCSDAASSAPAIRSSSPSATPSAGTIAGDAHPPARDGAGLVEHDRVDAAGRLQHLRALDQQPELGAAAGADEQGGRRREPERAGAGDDQHRDGGGEGEGRRLAGAEPEAERRDRDRDHDRHEDAGDAVGEPLHRRLAGLRVADEAGDLRQRRVGADLRRAHDEAAAGVDGRARDLVAGPLLDRHRLARQQRLVDGAAALLDDAVGRDLLAGADEEAVADGEPLDRDQLLGAVGVQPRDLLRAELQQRSEGGAGAALGARLEVAAGEDEDGHRGGRLEVDVLGAVAGGAREQVEAHSHPGHAGVAEEERVERPQPGGEHADRDERVHRRGRVLRVEPGGAVERPRAPDDDRRGERQRRPLPVVELQRGDHRDQQHREGERGRDQQAVPEGGGLVVGGVVGRASRRRAHPGPPARAAVSPRSRRRRRCRAAVLRRDGGRVVVDGRLLGRVVDARGDAVELVQLALDPVRARGAGHARDRQLDVLGHGAHRPTSTVKAAVSTRPATLYWRNSR